MRNFFSNTKLVYLTAGLFLVFLVLLIKLQSDQIQKKAKIKAEISSLEKQYNELDNKTNQLKNSLTYLSSPEYKEYVARQQLNLKKEGEAVYTFQTSTAQASENTAVTTNTPNSQTENLKSWWLYFFKTNEN